MTAPRPPIRSPADGVPPESLDASALPWVAERATPSEVRRGRNGYWSLTLDIEYEATLPDGRTLKFSGTVNVPGRQSGRPPGRPRRQKLHERQ